MATARRLAGRVAVITGAGAGIGRQIAVLFAKQGARVLCADCDVTAAQATVELIHQQQDHEMAHSLLVDVSKADDCQRMIAAAETHFGRVDILCNNAGVMLADDNDAIDTSELVWQRTMQINAAGVFFGCKFGIPALRRTGGGSIINTASFVALVGAATPQLAYTASKGAVLAMTRELACVHARENIRVNALCPGPLNTPLLQRWLDTEAKRQRRLVHVPIGRFGEAVEVAKAALFLASDDSSYVTGTSFMVDGGLTAAYTTSEMSVDPYGGPKEL